MPPSNRQRTGVDTSVARGSPTEDNASEDASSEDAGIEEDSGTSGADCEGSAYDSDDRSEDEDEEDFSNSEEEQPAIRRLLSLVPHPDCSGDFQVGLMAHAVGNCLRL